MTDHNNILEGEAWESDDDDSSFPSFVRNTMVEDVPNISVEDSMPSSSVVISGEAEETDEESEIMISSSPRTLYTGFGHTHSSVLGGMPYPSPSLSPSAGSDGKDERTRRPRFQSPIHKKLWERNFSLRCGIVEEKLDLYTYNSSRLQSSVPVLIRAQGNAQDALLCLKRIGEDMKNISCQSEGLFSPGQLPEFLPGKLSNPPIIPKDECSGA